MSWLRAAVWRQTISDNCKNRMTEMMRSRENRRNVHVNRSTDNHRTARSLARRSGHDALARTILVGFALLVLLVRHGFQFRRRLER